MNNRITATIALSVGFFSLLITGILLFATPYSYFQASLHTWSAVLVLAGFALHLRNNWKPYSRHLKASIGKRTFAICLLGLLPISYGLITEKAPVISLIKFGENIRAANVRKEGNYTKIELNGRLSAGKIPISVFLKTGASYTSEPQPAGLGLSYTTVPQMVIWLETVDGTFIDTLYITSKIANSSFNTTNPFSKETIRRPEALPVWGYRSGAMSSDGLRVPEVGSRRYDGIAAATPTGDHLLQLGAARIPSGTKVRLLLELNRSYDFNELYSKDRFPEDPIYSGSGSSGQPSLIYSSDIDLSNPGHTILSLVGRGHHSGQTGELYSDLSGITTAKRMLDFVIVSVEEQI